MAFVSQSVLVAVLSLEQYGVYSLASSISGVFGLVSNPTGQALHARVASLVGAGCRLATVGIVRSTTQLLAVMIGSLGATFALLPERVIMAWTGRPSLSRETASIVGLLCIAAAVNSFTVVPYRLRLAIGSTRFWMFANTMAAAVSVSGYLIFGPSFGLVGIAAVAVFVNLALVAVLCPISLRSTLGTQSWRWLLSDILLPVSGASVAVIGISTASARLAESRLQSAAVVIAGLCAALITAAACADRVRGAIAMQARRIWASFR
jgi:O-antigen/teichoic acid export membrane protein